MPDLEPESRPHSLVRSAGIVSGAVALSRVSGLVREMAMARLFGAGQTYDAFLLGFRIPNLTRDLFAEGALSSAFIPAFTQSLALRGKERAAELANLVATGIVAVVGFFCLAGVVFSPELVGLLAPGFAATPGKFELAVEMTRIMFPFLLLVALAAQAMGILNACDCYGVPALSSTYFNVGSVAFGLALGFWLGPHVGLSPIHGMAIGIVLGGALQLVSQCPSLRRAGFSFRPRFDLRDPDLRRIVQMMGPAILGNAAVQINVMVNTNFASAISDPVRGLDGPVSWLAYAFRFMQLPLGMFGVAIASATLPAISRSAAAKDLDDFRRTLARSLGLVFLLTVPSSAGLVVLGGSMIGAIYQGGKFQTYDTEQTALALSCYAIGLAGYAAIKVLAPAFYALGDSRTPMYVSLASIATNYVVAALLIRVAGMGHYGLAISTSAVAITGFVGLFWILRNRIGGIHGRALARSTAKILAASAVMAVVIWLTSSGIEAWLGPRKLGYVVDVALSIPLGAVTFFLAGRLLNIEELEMAARTMAPPLNRFLRPRVVKSNH